jgi:DNA-binding transcriptional ArsR family regulator
MFFPNILNAYRKMYLKYRTLSNLNAIYYLHILENYPGITVNEITLKLNGSQPIVSQNLAVLRKSGFVKQKKSGRNVFYYINYEEIDQFLQLSHNIFNVTLENLSENRYESLMKIKPLLKKSYLLFKSLTNKKRIYILDFLYNSKAAKINEMAEILEMDSPTISFYLKDFKSIGAIQTQNSGKQKIQLLNVDFFEKLHKLITDV